MELYGKEYNRICFMSICLHVVGSIWSKLCVKLFEIIQQKYLELIGNFRWCNIENMGLLDNCFKMFGCKVRICRSVLQCCRSVPEVCGWDGLRCCMLQAEGRTAVARPPTIVPPCIRGFTDPCSGWNCILTAARGGAGRYSAGLQATRHCRLHKQHSL